MTELDDVLELFTGECPYCGGPMERIDSGYDDDLDRPYDRYDCCDNKPGRYEADTHVDSETDEIL